MSGFGVRAPTVGRRPGREGALFPGEFYEVEATAAIGVDGPIREHYLVTVRDTADESLRRIEVGWPIFQTAVAG